MAHDGILFITSFFFKRIITPFRWIKVKTNKFKITWYLVYSCFHFICVTLLLLTLQHLALSSSLRHGILDILWKETTYYWHEGRRFVVPFLSHPKLTNMFLWCPFWVIPDWLTCNMDSLNRFTIDGMLISILVNSHTPVGATFLVGIVALLS